MTFILQPTNDKIFMIRKIYFGKGLSLLTSSFQLLHLAKPLPFNTRSNKNVIVNSSCCDALWSQVVKTVCGSGGGSYGGRSYD